MMVKRYLPVLEYMHKLSRYQQKKFLKNVDANLLKVISEICHNLNRDNLNLSPDDIKALKPYKAEILALCSRRRSISERRNLLQRGGVLGTILEISIPLLLDTLFPNQK